MKRTLSLLALCLMSASLYAQNLSPSQRYAEDRKLCAEESNASLRMQCLRDAKAEYNRQMNQARMNAQGDWSGQPARGALSCPECGRVVSVVVHEKEGEGGALGVIAGGVAGALLGNQVGGGTGRDLATIAGAAGGAYAGHKIEQRANTSKVWTVTVQYDDGRRVSTHYDADPGLVQGDLVRNTANGLMRR